MCSSLWEFEAPEARNQNAWPASVCHRRVAVGRFGACRFGDRGGLRIRIPVLMRRAITLGGAQAPHVMMNLKGRLRNASGRMYPFETVIP